MNKLILKIKEPKTFKRYISKITTLKQKIISILKTLLYTSLSFLAILSIGLCNLTINLIDFLMTIQFALRLGSILTTFIVLVEIFSTDKLYFFKNKIKLSSTGLFEYTFYEDIRSYTIKSIDFDGNQYRFLAFTFQDKNMKKPRTQYIELPEGYDPSAAIEIFNSKQIEHDPNVEIPALQDHSIKKQS